MAAPTPPRQGAPSGSNAPSPYIGKHGSPAYSTLQVSAAASILGATFGGLKATLRYAKRPAIAALSQGIEAALLGAGTWKIRDFYLASQRPTDRSLAETQVFASTLAGGAAFPIVTYFTRGSVLLLPFRAAFGAGVGYGLQRGFLWLEEKRATEALAVAESASDALSATSQDASKPPRETALQRFAKSKFSPFSILSDETYSSMLKEKMLVVDADIAVIDESIARLQGSTSSPSAVPGTESIEVAVVSAEESRERLARRREG